MKNFTACIQTTQQHYRLSHAIAIIMADVEYISSRIPYIFCEYLKSQLIFVPFPPLVLVYFDFDSQIVIEKTYKPKGISNFDASSDSL